MLSGNRPRYVHLRHTYPLIRYTNVAGRWRGNEPQSDALLIGRMETDARRSSQYLLSSAPFLKDGTQKCASDASAALEVVPTPTASLCDSTGE